MSNRKDNSNSNSNLEFSHHHDHLLETESKEEKSHIVKKDAFTLENIGWLIASILTSYYSDFFNVVAFDRRVNRSFLSVSLILIAINLLIAFYVIFWLSSVKKIDFKIINHDYFGLILVSTISFIFGSLILCASIWPIYSFLSVPILFTIFMGFLVLIINLPI